MSDVTSTNAADTFVCRSCGESLPTDAYERDKRIERGHLAVCRTCRVAKRRSDPTQVKRTINRDRLRHRHQSSTGLQKKTGKQDPVKQAARRQVNTAVRYGKITRPDTCQSCGGPGKVEAHHHDYSRPFDVEWLCQPCHKARHWKEVAA